MNTIKVTNLIVGRSGEILLIKEWSKRKNGYYWNLIKGTFDHRKDKSVLNAIERETKEELNLNFKTLGILSILEKKGPKGEFLIQINFVSNLAGKTAPAIPKKFEPDEEIIGYKWFSKKEFYKISRDELMSEDIVDIVRSWHKNQNTYPTSIFISYLNTNGS